MESQINWTEECRKFHDFAVAFLEKHGDAPFMLRIYPLPSEDSCVVWVEEEGLSDEARRKVRVINASLRKINPAAVLLQSDVWGSDNHKFSKYFGIPEDLPYDKFIEEYWRILKEKFDGRLQNAPDEVKSEMLTTVIKGPRVPCFARLTFYHRDGDKVIVDRTAERTPFDSGLISDWWESTVH